MLLAIHQKNQRVGLKKNIEVLEWPGNSPHLNPIKNLWGIIKRKIIKHCPSNLHELEWKEEITIDVMKNLVNSSTVKRSGP